MANDARSGKDRSPLDGLPDPGPASGAHRKREEKKAKSPDLPEPLVNPRLPPRAGRPYHLLIVDDEPTFLDLMDRQWKSHYAQQLELYLLNPEMPYQDAVVWVKDRLERGEPLDAIYVDRNLPAGMNGVEILQQIVADVSAARYLPRVIMTAHPDQEADEDTAALAAGAQRFMWKDSSHFLYEAALIVPQLQDAAKDQMWVDLYQQATYRVAQRADVRVLLSEVSTFLHEHFGIDGWYVRQTDGDGHLERLTPEDPYGGGEILDVREVPILADLLKDGKPRRVSNLTEAEIGRRFVGRLKDHRMIAIPLSFNGPVSGTVTLYRPPEEAPFRAKDEVFLTNLGMQVSAYLAEQKAQGDLRRRQSELLDFVASVDALESEDEILKKLAERLHNDVQRSDKRMAKTTVRKLVPAQGKIPRIKLLGNGEPRPRDELDIGSTHSVCAASIREGRTIHYGDVRRDAQGVYLATWDRARAELCVPVMAGDMALACANLENAEPEFYTVDDQLYAQALGRFAGEAMLRLRGRALLTQAMGLVASLVRPRGDLLDQAFRLLYDFLGFAVLLYLEPGPDLAAAWRVRRIYGDDGRPSGTASMERWQQTLDKLWSTSYLRSTLGGDQELFFTDDPQEICRLDAVNRDSRAQAVLHLYPVGNRSRPIGILSLEFRVPNPLESPLQKEILVNYGHFIGDLLRGGEVLQEYTERIVTAERTAQMAAAYRQFRHTLITRLGSIGNALNDLEEVVPEHPNIERIRGTLQTLVQQVKAVRHLIKTPEIADVSLSQVWNDQANDLAQAAAEAGVTLCPCDWEGRWYTDGEILAVILFNLLLNAVYYSGRGATVTLTVVPGSESVKLLIRDTGKGIAPDLFNRLFLDGITTSSEGGGFGLHFSRIRARDLGGDLEHDPKWTPGAGFVLTLPRLSND